METQRMVVALLVLFLGTILPVCTGNRQIHRVIFTSTANNFTNVASTVKIPANDILNDLLDRRLPAKVGTALKGINNGGLEGLNIKLGLPFKMDQVIVGFKLRLGALRNTLTKKASRYHLTPLLDTLYGRTTFDTPVVPGTVHVDCDFNCDSRTLYTRSRWVSRERDVEVMAAADTDNFLTDVGFEVSVSNSTERTRVSLNAAYDLKNQVLDGWTKFTLGDTSVRVTLDHVVKVAHKLDERNTVMPSVSLKNGAPAVGWKHKFSTGSLEAEYAPAESLDVVWRDEATYGTWTATASIPVHDHERSRISVTHDWRY